MNGNKGQLSLEFIMVLGVVLVLSMSLIFVLNESALSINSLRKQLALSELGRQIQSELLIASYVHDGYSRVFTLPQYVAEHNYTLNVTHGFLVLSSEERDVSFKIPPVQGNLRKGNNTITKEGGVLYLS